ncbi:ATP-binding protein [Allohahella sp. A8]|uniref:hybrid sensor histidine kinase/response regulator n=1 Tax=Allohahella sp. A8 TaxID=3141461 RepID=UPI003A80385F
MPRSPSNSADASAVPLTSIREEPLADLVPEYCESEIANTTQFSAADLSSSLLDASLGTAVLVGDSLVYQLANRAYCEIVGRNDLLGHRFDDVYPELVDTAVRAALQSVLETGRSGVSSEMPVCLHMDGQDQDRYFTCNITPLRRAAGQVYGVMLIMVDSTEQVLARRATERLNEELRLASRSKDDFLAMLGHELRNPLTPIVTALELMKLKYPEVQQEQVIIRRQVDHLVRLVDDLLDVSKITRGKLELRVETVDLREMLGRAVEMAADLFEKKNQRLKVDVPSMVWRGDPARMAQVVANLLTNASRYTPEGGDVQLRALATAAELIIIVEDNGVGISAALLPDIFELFVQGRRSVDRAEGGLGIGLALVRNLVHLHGGRVWAESNGEGQGSTFTVSLPLQLQGQAGDTALAESRPYVDNRHRRILVVDDNRDAVEALADLLGMHGYHVAIAYDPAQAQEIFARESFDVAILDIALPGMDGYDLALRLRSLDTDGACRLIALSGFGQAHDKLRSKQAGFAEHLVKPVDSQRLLTLLDSL